MGLKFTVTEKAKRPASNKNQCFYCSQKIGNYHKPDCALIKKKVKVKMTVCYEISVPASWSQHDIEFHRNDSSWCANNALDELKKSTKNKCLCHNSNFSHLEDKSEPFLDE